MKQDLKFIEKWFEVRFRRKPEQDKIYFNEWVNRFETGHPESFMDSESLRIYNQLKQEQER